MDKTFVYCGSWGFTRELKGIHVFSFDTVNKMLTPIGVFGEHLSQSIIAIRGDLLFCVSERRDSGFVFSYRIAPDGSLSQLDRLKSSGLTLSYVTLDPVGPYAFVSSMVNATLDVIRYDENGRMEITDTVRHMGHSVTPRQNKSILHGVFTEPDGDFIAAMNLGADEIVTHRLDRISGRLEFIGCIPIDPGRGPRHMVFHPSRKYAYVLAGMGSRVYAYKVKDGLLREIAAYNTQSFDEKQEGQAADIITSGDGRFLYATNRGQSNIACWKISGETGALEPLGHFPCGGVGPRGISMGPDDHVIFAANTDSDMLSVIAVDRKTGCPGDVLQTLDVPGACCIRLYPR